MQNFIEIRTVVQASARAIAIYPFFQDDGHTPFCDLWGKFWDNPQQEFGGLYLYHCAKLVRI